MKVTYENSPCLNCHECEDTHVDGKCLFGTTRYKKLANHRMHHFVRVCLHGFENLQKKQAAMLRVQPKPVAIHRAHCVWQGPLDGQGNLLGTTTFYTYDAFGTEEPHPIGNWIRVAALAQRGRK